MFFEDMSATAYLKIFSAHSNILADLFQIWAETIEVQFVQSPFLVVEENFEKHHFSLIVIVGVVETDLVVSLYVHFNPAKSLQQVHG